MTKATRYCPQIMHCKNAVSPRGLLETGCPMNVWSASYLFFQFLQGRVDATVYIAAFFRCFGYIVRKSLESAYSEIYVLSEDWKAHEYTKCIEQYHRLHCQMSPPSLHIWWWHSAED